MFLCTPVCAVAVCLSAQSERVLLGHPDVCTHLQKGQRCPLQQSVAACTQNHGLWGGCALSKVTWQVSSDTIGFGSTSWTGPYHKLSIGQFLVLSHPQMGKLRQLVQEV